MGSGRRCGCWALSELDLERSRHQATLEENMRYSKKIQDLQDELEVMHATISDLEKKYSDLSKRYRNTAQTLDEKSDSADRMKEFSNEMSNDNRRMKNQCERLQQEVRSLRIALETAKEDAEEERRQRHASETTLERDLEDTEKSCKAELRRVSSLHDMDAQHFREDINRLTVALKEEKHKHDLTKRTLHHHHASLHSNYYHCRGIWPCHDFCIP